MPQEQQDTGSALRSLLTAAATGTGVVGGAGLGAGAGVASSRKIMRRGREAMLHGLSSPIDSPLPHGRGAGTRKLLNKALGSGVKAVTLRALLGAALGGAGGGVGMYQLSKRKKKAMEAPSREQLLQALKGIGKATAGGAGIGGLVGAGIGAVGSNPDPERGRLIHILRMMLKGGAVGGGITAGALTGGLGAGVAARGIGEGSGMSRGNTAKLTSGATLGGALLGGGAGGALGAKLGADEKLDMSALKKLLLTAGGAAGVGAAAGAPIGAVRGAFADKAYPEQSRLKLMLKKILHDMAVGAAAGGSSIAGGVGGTLAGRGGAKALGLSGNSATSLQRGGGVAGMVGGGVAGGFAADKMLDKLSSEKRSAMSYILRGHLKQAMLADLQAAVGGR